MEREARAAVRAHQGLREEAGPFDQAGEGDRRAHGQQGTRPRRRDQVPAVADVDPRHLLGPPRRPPFRDEPAEGPDEGAALQRGQADEHPGPVSDEQAAAPARGRPAQMTTSRRQGARSYSRGMQPKTLDHVAFWVADREPLVEFATRHLGMHVVDEQGAFTLVGSNARRGKLTLFDADGPRERGAIKHVALRVSDLDAARASLPDGAGDEVEIGEGIRGRLVEATTDVDYDLDHVALFSADPEGTAERYLDLGFEPTERGPDGHPRVEVGGAYVEFHEGDPSDSDRPLLNHLAVLVDSADEHTEEAESLGIVDRVVDAANTLAVFVWGPDRVRIEYVEHKPGFALT